MVMPTAMNLVDCIMPFEAEQPEGAAQSQQKIKSTLILNAVLKVQSVFRMKLAMRKARKMRILLRKIKFIQSWIRVYLAKKRSKRDRLRRNKRVYVEFEELQKKLKEDWNFMKDVGRVELHFNSLGSTELEKLSISKFEQKQNMQIGRIFRVLQKGVEVIYISSSKIPEDIVRYYYKVLQLIGIPNPYKRVHFLVPEEVDGLAPHIAISSKILYCNRTVRKIKEIVNGRCCVMVGGIPNTCDIRLAVHLGYPILSGHPAKNGNAMNLAQTKEVRISLMFFPLCF
jgi:hypothetical protein